MLQYDLNAEVRNESGKGSARSLRRSGKTPAVMYGAKTQGAIGLQLDTKIFTQVLMQMRRRNAVFSLDIHDGSSENKKHVMLKEIQTDPIRDELLHADFFEISLDEPAVLDVAVKYSGKAKGVDLGGELNIAMESVKLKGLVLNIPDFLELNISGLGIGDKLSCSDLVLPEGVELMEDLETTCVTVAFPKGQASEEEEAEEGAEEEAAAEAPAETATEEA